MTKSDDVARMLGVTQAHEVPADATLAEVDAFYRGLAHRRAAEITKLFQRDPPSGNPLQAFESPRAKTLMRAWEEGWEACRDAEFVGKQAQNDAFNRSATVNHCIAEDHLHSPGTAHLNRDATVAVSPTYTYNEDMSQAPRGVKLILLGRGGVAQLSEYQGDPFWIGWAALPRRAGA